MKFTFKPVHPLALAERTISMNLFFAALMVAQSALAPILNAQHWIGPRPAANALAGKVVLVDVFTYSCINCKNVVPELRKLRREYSTNDVVIIGVHTPELTGDYIRSNVEKNLQIQGITWPVAIDNDHKLWDAYGVDAWPTQLIYDRRGHLSKTIVGDSQDEEVSATIRSLVGH
jgi:thiol-disulfide isomerase/thioredoxin